MNYAKTANRVNPAAMLGALGVPAAVGAVLVAGLAVTVVITPKIENPDVFDIRDEPQDPPPPTDPVEPTDTTPQTERVTQVVTPPTRPDSEFELGTSTPITTLPNPGDIPVGPIDLGGPIGTPSPIPSLPDPISASPSNNPSRWITDRDYRSRWVREGLSGRAGFALTIDGKGRVSDCTITRSSGHAALDEATCKLIESRARFDPAKDSYGNVIPGTYSSSVNWQLPE